MFAELDLRSEQRGFQACQDGGFLLLICLQDKADQYLKQARIALLLFFVGIVSAIALPLLLGWATRWAYN